MSHSVCQPEGTCAGQQAAPAAVLTVPGPAPRVKSLQRRAIKFCDKLEALLQLCANIPFPQLGGRSVVVLLGASVLRPREIYCFNLPPAMVPAGTAPASDKALSEATRKLMRGLIMQHGCISEWDQAPAPTKLFVLFQAAEGALPAAPPGFTAKRAFCINLRKAFQVNINLADPAMRQQQHYQQQHYQQQPVPQQQQPAGLHAGDAGAVADDAMELEQLSQQMSARMTLVDPGGEAGVPADGGCLTSPPVWYACSVFIKGLQQAPAAD